MAVEEIYRIEPDASGWRRLPNRNRIKLGCYVRFGVDVEHGDNVILGDYVSLGNGVRLGNDVTMSDLVMLGNGVTLGNDVKLGKYVMLGNGVKLGSGVRLADHVSLGNFFTLHDGVTSTQLNLDHIASYRRSAESHIFAKWVTLDRKSPNFDGGTTLVYPQGAIVEEVAGEVSDQQCGPGLHVLRVGVRPEHVGLARPEQIFLELMVRVRSEDILHAGMPGNDAMLRVRRLEVLT